MPDREPYEKPKVTVVDLSNLLDECDRLSKEIDQKFETLRHDLEELIEKIQALDVEWDTLAALVADLVNKYGKAQAICELREEAGR
jgi:predicted transcriptional regulator